MMYTISDLLTSILNYSDNYNLDCTIHGLHERIHAILPAVFASFAAGPPSRIRTSVVSVIDKVLELAWALLSGYVCLVFTCWDVQLGSLLGFGLRSSCREVGEARSCLGLSIRGGCSPGLGSARNLCISLITLLVARRCLVLDCLVRSPLFRPVSPATVLVCSASPRLALPVSASHLALCPLFEDRSWIVFPTLYS